jgi:hypothetical protein
MKRSSRKLSESRLHTQATNEITDFTQMPHHLSWFSTRCCAAGELRDAKPRGIVKFAAVRADTD